MDQPTTTTAKLYRALSAANLFGPIFGKELRVASRRFRNYFLRTFYVVVLTIVVTLVWFAIMQFSNPNTLYRTARMSEAAVQLLVTIGMFQFFALHLIAPVLTSTAISDEISHRTLGPLMMTPINALQIVTGKLFSRLLTMTLLVATSLPLLAIIRVFGGIEWHLILNIVALTLCSALFAAAVSLTFSVFHKRAYAAILMTYMTLAAIYVLIPLLLEAARNFRSQAPGFFAYFNPFISLIQLIQNAVSPLARGGYVGWSWPPYQCAMLLAATALLTILAAALVRRTSLRLASGEEPFRFRRKRRHAPAATHQARHIRRVSGNPVLWRELRVPILPTKRKRTILVCFVLIALALTYIATARELDEEHAHVGYTVAFMIIGLVIAAVLSAANIPTEKESSSWDALLATALSPTQILTGKAFGALRRLTPLAALFLAHVGVFCLLGVIHPLAIPYTVLILAGPVIFLIGTGTYFGLRVKRTTTAVMLNLGLGIFLWILLPLFGGLLGAALYEGDEWFEAMLTFNPVVMDVICFAELAEGGWRRVLAGMRFDWPSFHSMSVGEHTIAILAFNAVYTLFGIATIAWAALRFRRLTRS